MHSKIKQAWVEALRSKQYQQGYGALRQPAVVGAGVRHCALGVLLDLIAKHPEWPSPSVDSFNAQDVLTSAGVTQNQWTLIARLNDRGVPFPEIADVVERDLDSEPDLIKSVSQRLEKIAQRVSMYDPSFVKYMVNNGDSFKFNFGIPIKLSSSSVLPAYS